jgi:hypothetical protein
MAWTKLGDEFGDQCWELPDDAWRLHVEGLIWSNGKHTDGRLLKSEMRRWAKHPEAAEELVARGWWEDSGDHYQVIHHQGVQRTAARWRAQSAANSQNGRRGGLAKKATPKSKPPTESLSESQTETGSKRDRTGLDRTGPEKRGTELNESDGRNGNEVTMNHLCVCGQREAQGSGAWYPELCKPCADQRLAEASADYEERCS